MEVVKYTMLGSCVLGFGFTMVWALLLLWLIIKQKLLLDVISWLCVLQVLQSLFAMTGSFLLFFNRDPKEFSDNLPAYCMLTGVCICIGVSNLIYDMKVRNMSIALLQYVDQYYLYKLKCAKLSEAAYYLMFISAVFLPPLMLVMSIIKNKFWFTMLYSGWLLTLFGSLLFLLGAYRRINSQLKVMSCQMRRWPIFVKLVCSVLLILIGISTFFAPIDDLLYIIITLDWLVVTITAVQLNEWRKIVSTAAEMRKEEER
jgi:hypothetical protein